MKKRFSKQEMLNILDELIQELVEKDGFDTRNGWQQVDGKGEALNRDYGEFDAYLSLWFSLTGEIYQ